MKTEAVKLHETSVYQKKITVICKRLAKFGSFSIRIFRDF